MLRNAPISVVVFASLCCPVVGQIYRWDDGQVILGTEGVVLGPGVQLDHRQLEYARLGGQNLTDASFARTDLSHARLEGADLHRTDFSDAIVSFTNFMDTTYTGFTREQLYSTASYKNKDLRGLSFQSGIEISKEDLSGWTFANQNLERANFSGVSLEGADFADAVLRGARFDLSAEQLYSTASYKMHDLRGVWSDQLNGVNLSGQNLSFGRFYGLMGADLSEANLTGASFSQGGLENANFAGANLADADLSEANLTGAELSLADLRGATLALAVGVPPLQNTISPDGSIHGLDLGPDARLVVRDDDGVPDPAPEWWIVPRPSIAIEIENQLLMGKGALELRFDADPWDSTISFEPGIPVELGGRLELTFAKEVDPTTQVGHTLHLFNWTGVSPTGAFTVSSLYDWDLSHLYTTGKVTLLAANGVIAGDATGDGQVSLLDFGVLQDHFGVAGIRADGDANGDGHIDLSDFGLLKANFGKSATGNVAVPEPSAIALALTGCFVLLARRVQSRFTSPWIIASVALAAWPTARADIFRWDNGEAIPGTEGVTPGPGVWLADWNSEAHNLWFADFAGRDLTQAGFSGSWLANASFGGSTLTGADLSGAKLENAGFPGSTLTGANLSGAVVKGASFSTTRGFTQAQLASTASYLEKDLSGIDLGSSRLFSTSVNDLSGWDFSGQNLTNAKFSGSRLTGANLGETVVKGVDFGGTTSRGFTQAQLASTASYKEKDLSGIELSLNDLSGWDFNGQNLTNASFGNEYGSYSYLTGANLSGAVVRGANFGGTTSRGLTQAQLASTASYQEKDLSEIGLSRNDLSGWDFSRQNLTNASFYESTLTGADLSGANLTQASLLGSTLTGADLSGSNLENSDLVHADLTGANLSGARLPGGIMWGVTLSGADTRGAEGPMTGALASNTILPDGRIAGLKLNPGEQLIVRDDDGVPDPPPSSWLAPRGPIAIEIGNKLAMTEGAVLELRFDADRWDSPISFQPGIPVQLGGTLELTFAQDVELASQVGRTLNVFDWTGVSPTGIFTVSSPYRWDLSHLYTTGEVTLLAAGGAIAGDFTGDGQVTLIDFGLLKDNFGAAGNLFQGDGNGDGHIDLSDFGLLKADFGKSANEAVVPEPMGLAMFATGLLAISLLGKKSRPREVFA